MPLSDPQVATIQSTLPLLHLHGPTITKTFYSTLLSENPSLLSIFNITHQRTVSQPLALASVLAAYAAHITNPSALGPAVAAINHRHASLGVTPAQYDVVGTYLLRAMAEVLGAGFTQDVKGAWAAAYGDLAAMMIRAEEGMYAASRREEWEGFRKCRVVQKEVEGDRVVSLRFWPMGWSGDVLPGYAPGQYVSVRVWVEAEGVSQVRQYTLSDAPERARRDGWRITPKRIGMVSEVLHGLEVGDEVEVSWPRGVFYLDEKAKVEEKVPVVLISAGIGVTPMVSILTTLLAEEEGSRRKISWIHSDRSVTGRPFKGLVESLQKQVPILRTSLFVTGPAKDEKLGEELEGRVNLDKLDAEQDLYVGDERTVYFLCGPAGFMESMGKGLKGLGVAEERIKAEVFGVGNPSI